MIQSLIQDESNFSRRTLGDAGANSSAYHQTEYSVRLHWVLNHGIARILASIQNIASC